MKKQISGGLVHEVPANLITAATATEQVTELWESLTPAARNEFLCWIEDALQIGQLLA